MQRSTRWAARVAALAGVLVPAVAGAMAAQAPAMAAVSCRVDYAVTNQWQGGFGANVTIHNVGDAVNGWRLTWSFGAGQQVTQAWNATVTQAGGNVTAVDAGYNAAIPSGGNTSFGFNGSWNGANPNPVSFSLNGVPCTGAPGSPSASPSPSLPPSPPVSPSPSAPSGGPTTPPGSYPNPGRVTGDTGVHDPSVAKRPDGGYLLAHTGDNIVLKTSPDRTAWRNAGVVFPGGAPWTTSYTGGSRNLWAPDISYHNGRYYLYYSASSFGSSNSAIFLATSTSGASGSWTNEGMIISTNSSSGYNAIDPNLVIDDQGRWWLSFGSFWSGIKLIQLDPATGKRLDNTVRSIAQRPGSTAIEAPFIFKHGGYYYLWASFDMCCRGASSTYRIMVGRSSSVTGPYVDRNGVAMTSGGGTQVLAGHGGIHGPGHQAVINDGDGDVLFYHYYADNGAALLGINKIGYDSAGWPFVY
ncbi:family 43 glycosylhydrolase [Microbispora sp. NPDC046933]|uniref:family 43 glycosylhydrolase n=1 Tax=Microbispora sp. NPDC046933 TaxID=3155618 RepID=UPI0033F15F3A